VYWKNKRLLVFYVYGKLPQQSQKSVINCRLLHWHLFVISSCTCINANWCSSLFPTFLMFNVCKTVYVYSKTFWLDYQIDLIHSACVLHTLQQQQKLGKYCDLKVLVGDKQYFVHRCILAAASAQLDSQINVRVMSLMCKWLGFSL